MLCAFLLASILAVSDPRSDLLDLLGGEWVSQGIYVAAKLDIGQHLQKGPKTSHELAELLQVDDGALYRLMSMLSSQGVFEEREGKVFANTPMSERMASGHPETLRSLIAFYGEEIRSAFGSLLNAVTTGQPSFDQVYQEPVFDYFKHHPERAALFQSAMAEKSKAVIQSVISQVNFKGTICDVGGGKGHLLNAIVNANPSIDGGINFDLPEVIASLPKPPSKVKLQGGTFFDAIPTADAYLMKSILHDWSDEKAVEILRSCHTSMPDHATLYVIEPVLMTDTRDYAKLTDVLMLAVTGGRERSMSEYIALFNKSGFVISNVFSTPTEFRILEIKKK
jgi:hypothetical protein